MRATSVVILNITAYLSYCCPKTMTKSDFGEKGFISTYSAPSQTITEGSQGRNASRRGKKHGWPICRLTYCDIPARNFTLALWVPTYTLKNNQRLGPLHSVSTELLAREVFLQIEFYFLYFWLSESAHRQAVYL